MGTRILIIEDDIFLGDVLAQKLKAGGYEAILARDGASGLQQLQEAKPDLVLLDVVLPKMNGYEILIAKQKDPSISSIPVIMISNSGQPVEINRALVLGVKDYIVKAHFDPDEVIEKVKLQLGKTKNDTVLNMDTSSSSSPNILSELAGMKIMWVEDDKFLSDIIGRKLKAQECELVHATNGEEAIGLIEATHPDLILLDILLSGIDGFEILKRVKGNEKTKHIPVILLSNLGQREDIEKGKSLGAARFLIKATVTLDEIVEEIKTVLKEAKK